ncbi:MAG TPA: hypothetical protein VE030_09815 [Burkholderiales bacterium]|nr:hypothetical protein [Burkholderiales bacterium]
MNHAVHNNAGMNFIGLFPLIPERVESRDRHPPGSESAAFPIQTCGSGFPSAGGGAGASAGGGSFFSALRRRFSSCFLFFASSFWRFSN